MTSEISQVSSAGGGSRVQLPSPAAAAASNQQGQPVPKPIKTSTGNSGISFDPSQARRNVKEAVSILNEQMSSNSRGIGFTLNEASNTPIVTVRNTQTGEVVRQIPNEVVIKLAEGLGTAKGALHNKQA